MALIGTGIPNANAEAVDEILLVATSWSVVFTLTTSARSRLEESANSGKGVDRAGSSAKRKRSAVVTTERLYPNCGVDPTVD